MALWFAEGAHYSQMYVVLGIDSRAYSLLGSGSNIEL